MSGLFMSFLKVAFVESLKSVLIVIILTILYSRAADLTIYRGCKIA